MTEALYKSVQTLSWGQIQIDEVGVLRAALLVSSVLLLRVAQRVKARGPKLLLRATVVVTEMVH